MKVFETDEIDFGTVKKGSTGTVKVKYIGEEKFNIKNMRTSCSCTTPSFNEDTQEVTFSTTFRNPGDFRATGTYLDLSGKHHYVVAKAVVE